MKAGAPSKLRGAGAADNTRHKIAVSVTKELKDWVFEFSDKLGLSPSEVTRNLYEGLQAGRVKLTRDPEIDKATKEAFE